eukprot:Colp12_sorted_trinity150504_noHs@9405
MNEDEVTAFVDMASNSTLEEELKKLEIEKADALLKYDQKIKDIKTKLAENVEVVRRSSIVEPVVLPQDEVVEYVEEPVTGEPIDAREGLYKEPAHMGSTTPETASIPLQPAEATTSIYGRPLTPEQAAELVPPSDEGLEWQINLVVDKDEARPQSAAIYAETGEIKPRRPVPTARASEFFNSLVKTPDGRWIFSGILNGWPALTLFELRSVSVTVKTLLGGIKVKPIWDASDKNAGEPAYPKWRQTPPRVVCTLRAPHWTAYGWTPTSPGFVWWYSSIRSDPWFAHGEDMIRRIRELQEPEARAVRAHLFAHRYAMGDKPETAKNKMTWHAAVLLEWDHGNYCTVIELATLNGIGGRFGKSNWYHDKLSERPELYRAMPAAMIAPWKGMFAEVRCNDVKAKTKEEFMAYLKQYTGPKLRFLDPEIAMSAEVRLSFNRQEDIVRFLINYSSRDRRYTEEFRNCQTFAADFFGFLIGKKDIKPYYAANRVMYQPRQHLFLYDPNKYKFAPGQLHK